ncbi:MAG: TraB/GumN family protein [Flavobacteriales bacterium]|nr:MAG: TraB/GumN family protein [Flavobacteriales bacterium]
MRKIVSLILLFFGLIVSAQEAHSLLWEISGNGLAESSYLYGTMHVSKRIAFRLDDVFYEALDQSEAVDLESDPGTWLDNDDLMGFMGPRGNGFYIKGFYTHPFLVKNPRKEEMASHLAFDDSRVNSILYRSNNEAEDFEEETYLDMFIYQSGKKFDKRVLALEDLEESSALVARASLNPMKQKPDEWLQKKMQQQDFSTLLQNAYRDRNINLLDSIDKGMYTEHYLENMLFIRNRNMAQRLDSIFRTAKTFTGIGAAHLPGKRGVIAILRQMGYTVKPLSSKSTVKGKQIKEKLEQSIKQNDYQSFGPDDHFFSIDLHNKLYPVSEKPNTIYVSPDLANGSFVMVNRIPTFSYLKQDEVYSLDDLDRMLFENIPGKILEKARIKRNGFEGLDIKNQLKNGDHQRYHIFLTPLEILIFKMGGDGDYVIQHSDTIFNSIRFKELNHDKETVASGFDDFEIVMPKLYSFTNRFRNGDRLVQGYDSISDSYYFLRKATLNDFNFLEEDQFELKQIQKRFYQDLKLEPQYLGYNGNSLSSKALIDHVGGKWLYLKTTFKRGDYYLLGMVTAYEAEATAYFDSLVLQEAGNDQTYERVIDTAMFFSTLSTVKPPKFVESSKMYLNGRNRPKAYEAYNKKTVYQNKNNEAVTVTLNKSHDFMMFPSIDSVWALRKALYGQQRFLIADEKASSFPDGRYELELTLADSASSRGVLIKNVLKGGLLYEVKAQVDTIGAPSRFVSEFFENFVLFDTIIGNDILSDRTYYFFKALRTNDSIVHTGFNFIQFQKKHIDSLKHYIADFTYPDDKKYLQAYLIQQLGKLDDPRVVPFLQELYKASYNNSNAQTKILQSVSCKSDDRSVNLLLELLSQDLPLISNTAEIQKIFRPYSDSLPLAKKLYPEILEYSAIEEYNSPIFSILAKLQEKGLVKPNNYKKYQKQILNDAKIQLKRALGNVAKNLGDGNKGTNTFGVLEDYAVLLYPFRDEKDVKEFFNRLLWVSDRNVRTTYAMLMAQESDFLPQGLLEGLASDLNSRLILFNKLQGIDKLQLFPSKYRSERYLAESLLYENGQFNKNRDSLFFMGEKPLRFKDRSLNGYYFKSRNRDDYDQNFKISLVVFEKGKALATKPYYKLAHGARIEDTDTDEEAMEWATEEFLLKDRPRAEVYRPNSYGGFGYHGW